MARFPIYPGSELSPAGPHSSSRIRNRDVRSVARLLGATDIVEGAIRKKGSHVRISVQLIRGTDGVQLWSRTYDRNLTDIFAIQEEIASSIAVALRVPLGLQPG